MNYTLIAYKPNNDDYCMGCHMASYSSDFELFHTIDKQELVNKWLSIHQQERSHDDRECGYDITILVNGQPLEKVNYDEFLRLKTVVNERLVVWNKQQDEEDTRKKEKQEQSIAQQEQDRERAMYLKLKEKFGEQT